MDALLETVADFEEPEQIEKIDILAETKRLIQKAKAIELKDQESAALGASSESVSLQLLNSLYVQGDYDKVIELGTRTEKPSVEIKTLVSRAHNMQGISLSEACEQEQGEKADRLWAQAVEKFAAALALKPDLYQALNNWGNALSRRARRTTGEEADRLWARAVEKYAASLAINPDYFRALHNWGGALLNRAQQKNGTTAELLLAEASEKLSAAHRLVPNDADILYVWAEVLENQAALKSGPEAEQLLAWAAEKLEAAKALEDPASDQ